MGTFLVDFVAYKPPEEWSFDLESFLTHKAPGWGPAHEVSSPETTALARKLYKSTGVGLGHFPPNLTGATPHTPTFEDALAEARLCLEAPTEQLLLKTGLTGTAIDIVITCSTFSPVPSLASMLVNKFKMRPEVKALHLGGMGCSAGAIAINIAHDMLKANPNCNLLLVTAEVVSTHFYTGSQPEKLLAPALFRVGSAALLLSNKPSLARTAKYKLQHSARVHIGAEDWAFTSMGFAADADSGTAHVSFTPDVSMAVQTAISAAIKKVAPKILSWRQRAAYVRHMALDCWGRDPAVARRFEVSFADSIDHFLLHPGIHGMLRGFMKGLKLPVERVLPSAAALRDYGNTSASSTYYVLAYIESLQGISRGQTVMQVAVGSGVKAGINVWRAVRDVKEEHPAWKHLAHVPVTEGDLLLPLSSRPGASSPACHTGKEQADGAVSMLQVAEEMKQMYAPAS